MSTSVIWIGLNGCGRSGYPHPIVAIGLRFVTVNDLDADMANFAYPL